MKVYVDELPKSCEDCVCHNGVSGRCKILHRVTFDIPPRDCPLQSLSDYTKQVRKEVVQEIKDNSEYVFVNEEDINKIVIPSWQIPSKVLDQIQDKGE